MVRHLYSGYPTSMRLPYRCFAARGEERATQFGDFGLVNQLGSATDAVSGSSWSDWKGARTRCA
jgi:hypothetical protein